jgi:hypothetical protein
MQAQFQTVSGVMAVVSTRNLLPRFAVHCRTLVHVAPFLTEAF